MREIWLLIRGEPIFLIWSNAGREKNGVLSHFIRKVLSSAIAIPDLFEVIVK